MQLGLPLHMAPYQEITSQATYTVSLYSQFLSGTQSHRETACIRLTTRYWHDEQETGITYVVILALNLQFFQTALKSISFPL